MIKVTSLQKTEFVVNADLIEFIESTPDTLITLTTGKKLMVAESLDRVVELVTMYRRKIYDQRTCIKRSKRPNHSKDRNRWIFQR
ncbi:flagellar FlbD family protein [candidate division KSB1 bacterium]|nr:flagellar FlbD family protein [candidate division KSB1 bacterium]